MIAKVKRRPRLVKPAISITEALRDPLLLGAALGDPATWKTWFIILKAIFGEHLN